MRSITRYMETANGTRTLQIQVGNVEVQLRARSGCQAEAEALALRLASLDWVSPEESETASDEVPDNLQDAENSSLTPNSTCESIVSMMNTANDNTSKQASLAVGDHIKILKGCKARSITKNAIAKIVAIEALGADYSHSVRVFFRFQTSFLSGKTVSFYARHINRLSDAVINLNDGNPLHTIQVRSLLR